MNHAAHTNAAFRATGGFLGQIMSEIRHMRKMEVGTTKRAMRVFCHHFFCGAQEWREGLFANDAVIVSTCGFSLRHPLIPPLSRRPFVVVAPDYIPPFGTTWRALNGKFFPWLYFGRLSIIGGA